MKNTLNFLLYFVIILVLVVGALMVLTVYTVDNNTRQTVNNTYQSSVENLHSVSNSVQSIYHACDNYNPLDNKDSKCILDK